MKKYILLAFIGFNFVCLHAQKNYHSTTNHAIAIRLNAGYTRMDSKLSTTSTLGGGGLELGLGYEVGNNPGGLLIQTGIGIAPHFSTMRYNDWIDEKLMYDTEGILHTAYFTFHNTREIDFYVDTKIDFLVGYKWAQGCYFLVGPKIAYALYGIGETVGSLTKSTRYNGLIGDDGNGLFSNMPNHSMQTQKRRHEQEIYCNPYVGCALEVGYNVLDHVVMSSNASYKKRKPDHHSLRLALFCEYGCRFNWDEINTPLLVDQAKSVDYQPAMANYLYHRQRFIPSLFCGVKMTYLIQYKARICVGCNPIVF